MKISWCGFLGKNHSWSIVGQSICRELDKLGHVVHMKTTNGLDHFPNDLKRLLKDNLDDDYDMKLSYTALKNFDMYLNQQKKAKKLGIWAFEFAGKNALPQGFAKHYKDCDLVLPPSKFVKQIFADSGIPDGAMEVVPHGYNLNDFDSAKPYDLKSDKVKILLVAGQIHKRKGVEETLDAFGSAFTKKDNVILVLKVVDKKAEQPFEVAFSDIWNRFRSKYPNHAGVKIIRDFVPNIFSLYKACDIYFHLTKCEGFGIPFFDAAISGLVNISPKYGGMLDFLNDDNAMLVDGKIETADPKALYYEWKPGTHWYTCNKDDAVSKLRYAVDNIEKLKDQHKKNSNHLRHQTWENVANKIIGLV